MFALGPRLEKSYFGDEVVFPASMESGAHGIIHEIIVGGDRVENFLDPVFFFLDRDLLVAEIDCLGREISQSSRSRESSFDSLHEHFNLFILD